jgi:hypothetical protein
MPIVAARAVRNGCDRRGLVGLGGAIVDEIDGGIGNEIIGNHALSFDMMVADVMTRQPDA